MDKRPASPKNYTYIAIIVLLLVIIGVMMVRNNSTKEISNHNNSNKNYPPVTNNSKKNNLTDRSIEALTDENTVVSFVKENGRLPECYITKKQARQQGWNAGQGNLCDILPGKAIGGDIFTNRDGQLPEIGRASCRERVCYAV